jgi:hypothetical protein
MLGHVRPPACYRATVNLQTQFPCITLNTAADAAAGAAVTRGLLTPLLCMRRRLVRRMHACSSFWRTRAGRAGSPASCSPIRSALLAEPLSTSGSHQWHGLPGRGQGLLEWLSHCKNKFSASLSTSTARLLYSYCAGNTSGWHEISCCTATCGSSWLCTDLHGHCTCCRCFGGHRRWGHTT